MSNTQNTNAPQPMVQKPKRLPLPNDNSHKGNSRQQPVTPAEGRRIIQARKLPGNVVDLSKVTKAPKLLLGSLPSTLAEKATALENDLDLIYEYCYTQIKFIPGFGANKGPLTTMLDGAGNAFDISSLMVALLREAGYTCDFMFGEIRLASTDWYSWLRCDVSNVFAAANLLGNGGVPNTAIWTGTEWVLDVSHVWVRVTISGTDYYFDPSKKAHTFIAGVDLKTAMGFNLSSFLSDAQSGASVTSDSVTDLNVSNIRSNLQTMTDNLVTWIDSNAADSSTTDLIGGKTISQPVLGLRNTSLGYETPGSTPTVWTDIPNGYKSTFGIDYDTISVSFYSTDIASSRITLFFNASHEAELRVDGTLVATSSAQGIGTWNSVLLTAQHPYPSGWTDQSVWHQVWADKPYAIGHSWGQAGDTVAYKHKRVMNLALNAGQALTSEAVLGSALAMMSSMWNAEVSRVTDFLDTLCGVSTVQHHHFGLFGHFDTIQENIGGASWFSSPWDNDYDRSNYHRTAVATLGVTLEAMVIDQLSTVGGVSTTPLIDAAMASGMKIYSATAANWSTNVRPNLVNYDTATLDDIENYYIPYDWVVYVPEDGLLARNAWNGYGYFAVPISPWSGSIGIIGGGLKGGSGDDSEIDSDYVQEIAIDTLMDMYRNSYDYAIAEIEKYDGDPVNFQNGSFTHSKSAISAGTGPYPYKIDFASRYGSLNRFSNGPLGRGWSHNHQIKALTATEIFPTLGDHSPKASAATLVALTVNVEILKDLTRPNYKYLTTVSVAQYWADSCHSNSVMIHNGKSAELFVRLPDGTFVAETISQSKLVQNVDLTYSFTDADKVNYNFNLDGNIEEIVFPFGITVSYSYTAGKLTSITNNVGSSLNLTYSSDKIVQVDDGNGRQISFAYDVDQNLTTFTTTELNDWIYHYAAKGLLNALYLPENPAIPVFENSYDSQDRVKSQTNARGHTIEFKIAGHRSAIYYQSGNRHVKYFNERGVWTRHINGDGEEIVKVLDGANRPIQVIRPEGNSTAFTYDQSSGNVLAVAEKPKTGSLMADVVTQVEWDNQWNKISKITLPGGQETAFEYDAITGLGLKVTRAAIGGITSETHTTYNSLGLPTSFTDETGQVIDFQWNLGTAQLASIVIDPGVSPHLNIALNFTYDTSGCIETVTDAQGNVVTLTRDDAQRITQAEAPAPFNYQYRRSYDANGNLLTTEKQTSDPLNPWQITTAEYSADCYLTKVQSAGNIDLEFGISNENSLETLTSVEDGTLTMTYDQSSRLWKILDPANNLIREFSYSDNGFVSSIKDPRSYVTQILNDDFDRVFKIVYPDLSSLEYGYDAHNRIVSVQTRAGDIFTRGFDARGRLISDSSSSLPTVTYVYDDANRPIEIGTPVVLGDVSSGSVLQSYDTAGRQKTEQSPDGKTVSLDYDSAGNVIKITYPDGYFVEREYDEMNRLIAIKLNGSPSNAVELEWDSLSRRSKLTYSNGVVTYYGFDDNSLLNRIQHNFGTSSVEFTAQYDRNGRLVEQSVDDTGFIWHPAVASTVSYGTANNLDQWTTIAGSSVTYDANGNLTDNGSWSYSYNGRSQLISATDGTDTVNYKYDALGRRVLKEVVGLSERRYFYFKHQRIADYDNNTDTLEMRYVHGTSLDEVLFCIDSAGVVQFLSYDLNKSVIGITDAIGGLVSTFSYSAFGESSGILDGMPSYQGQRYDATLNLYDFKYRIYSQQYGRFMQPDPVAQPADNKYLFVGNSPLNFKDPLGLTLLSNLYFLDDFIKQSGPQYRIYGESSIETQELKNSPLGAFVQMAAFGVGKDNTSDNPLEIGFESMDAAKLTMLPGVKMLATGNTEKAISSDSGMLGNTAFQLGGVKRDPRNAQPEQEWIQLYRQNDKYVTVTLRNVANTSSFLYHIDQYINDDVLAIIALSLPGLADSLRAIKSRVKDENQQTFRTVYQTFSWTVYAPLPKGYCGKG